MTRLEKIGIGLVAFSALVTIYGMIISWVYIVPVM